MPHVSFLRDGLSLRRNAHSMTHSTVCSRSLGSHGGCKFTGKERDTESGLDYFGARYYASNMGRMMSPDWSSKAEPVPYAKLDDPQSLNLYSYVRNNPLRFVDADGHEIDLKGDDKDKATEQQRLAANASKTDKNGVKESSLFKQTTDKNGKTTLTLDKKAAAGYEGKHSAGYNLLNAAIADKGVISVQMTNTDSKVLSVDGPHSMTVGLDRNEAGVDRGQINPFQIIAGHEVLGHGLNYLLGVPDWNRHYDGSPTMSVENLLRQEQGLPPAPHRQPWE